MKQITFFAGFVVLFYIAEQFGIVGFLLSHSAMPNETPLCTNQKTRQPKPAEERT